MLESDALRGWQRGALPVEGAVRGREGRTVAAQRTLQGSWQRRKQKRRLGAPGQGKRSVCLYLDVQTGVCSLREKSAERGELKTPREEGEGGQRPRRVFLHHHPDDFRQRKGPEDLGSDLWSRLHRPS